VLFLNGSNDTNLVKANYSVATNTFTLSITYRTAGTTGNAFTLATTVTGATISGATLSGGVAQGNAMWVNIANAINNGNSSSAPSKFVTATAGAGTGGPVLALQTTLSGGTDGDAGVTDAILMGQDVLPRKGVFALR